MKLLASLRSFAFTLTHRNQMESEMDEELRSHIQHRADDIEKQSGMPRAEAERRARLELGSHEKVKEECREALGTYFLDTLLRDIRFGFRMLRKSPGFTAAAVAILALGIGVNATVFSVTNAVLFKGFPLVYRNDRILYITTGGNCCVSYPDFEDWRAQAKSFEGMAIVHGGAKAFSDSGGFPETYNTTDVSADTFKLVGQKPILGRDFVPSDESPGAAPVVILRYGLWERRYGKDPAIIGRTVHIDGVLTTVIGVMPQGFSFPQNQDLWLPLVTTVDVQKRENRDTWFVFGRMADGTTIDNARAEMATIGRRLGDAYPHTNQGQNLTPHVQDFDDFFIGPNATLIYKAMLGAVLFVLLIACANLANLLLGRAIGRSREISVRMALGAGRWRIVRQLLIESVMISGLGGFFGWLIARWTVHTYALVANGPSLSDAIAGTWFDNMLDYRMDYRVFIYLLVISIGTGLLFGLAPAFRLSKLDVNAALKDGGRGATTGGREKRLSALLVIGEMVLALVLLAGAGVMIRSFLNIYTADVGVKTENVLAGLLNLPNTRYPNAQAQISFFDHLKARLEALPGVESVAIADELPVDRLRPRPFELAGTPPVDQQRRPLVSALTISSGYFQTLGATVLSGRDFNDLDGLSGIPAVLVNEHFAANHWPGEDPLGKRLRLFDGTTPEKWLTVVGVVSNIVQDSSRQKIDPLVYLPFQQKPAGNMWIFAQTGIPPNGLANAFRREVQAIDPDLPISLGPTSLTNYLAWTYEYKGVSGGLFLIFATIALLLASVGLYSVIAFSVSQRTQEIGIRMALGATEADILKLVFIRGMLLLGVGLTVGLAASFAVNHILRAELVQVSPSDPLTLIVASVVLIFSAALGCLIPAWQATRVDPVVALRHE